MTCTNRVVPLFAIAIAAFLASVTLSLEGQTPPARDRGAGPFDDSTNGTISPTRFAEVRVIFDEREESDEGLGPVYNALGCGECHQNPVVEGSARSPNCGPATATEAGNFVDAPGVSLINDRAIHPDIQERVGGADNIRTFRVSTSVLGAGFVEAIDSNTLADIARSQPGQSAGVIAGQLIQVPVLEAPGTVRVGRFGWKNQHASIGHPISH